MGGQDLQDLLDRQDILAIAKHGANHNGFTLRLVRDPTIFLNVIENMAATTGRATAAVPEVMRNFEIFTSNIVACGAVVRL
jgi:hypothetical protein